MATATVNTELTAKIRFNVDHTRGDQFNPDEYEFNDMELETLNMFGGDWTEKELRLTFGDIGAMALIEMCFNNVEDWEND